MEGMGGPGGSPAPGGDAGGSGSGAGAADAVGTPLLERPLAVERPRGSAAAERPAPGTGSADDGPAGQVGPAGSTPPPPARRPRRLRGLRLLTVVVGAGVLALTAVLSWLAATVHRTAERHLLSMEVHQAATTLATAALSIQPQLADALHVAQVTGSPAAFRRFAGPKVGAEGQFVSVSLWQLSATGAEMVTRVGTTPRLVADRQVQAFVAHVHPSAVLQVTGILPGNPPALGYGELPPGDTSLMVYAESRLPSHHKLVVPRRSAFKDLNFAIYLGRRQRPGALIEASVPTPVRGEHASDTVPFGDSALTIVAAPTAPLSGTLSLALPWIVAGVGVLLAAASASVVEYVLRRRVLAERLAAANEQLYVRQRDIAETLQRALLADPPSPPALDVAARYLPGVQGIDVGGDWYDVLHPGDGRCLFVVGDVSGRGLRAATTMASLRFAARAYLLQGDGPAAVLAKLGRLLELEEDHRFATVLVGTIDLASGRVTVASAGHYPPVLVTEDGARLVALTTGPPVGVEAHPAVPETVIEVPRGATVLAFTDGLVERRGEHLDAGLARLCDAAARACHAAGGDPSSAEVVERLIGSLIPEGTDDDVVVLALRWRR